MARPTSLKTPLAKLRAVNDLDVGTMARRIGISNSSLEKLECGQTKMTLATARKIGKLFAASPLWIMSGDPAGPVEASIPGMVYDPKRVNEERRWLRQWRRDPTSAPKNVQAIMEREKVGQANGAMRGYFGLLKLGLEDGKWLDLVLEMNAHAEELMQRYYPERHKMMLDGDKPARGK